MALTRFFSQSASYTATQDSAAATIFAARHGTSGRAVRSGVIPTKLGAGQVLTSSGLNVRVNPFDLVFNGEIVSSDSQVTLSVGPATTAVQFFNIVVDLPTNGSAPSVVSQTTAATASQYLLAIVQVTPNAASLTAGDIWDRRTYTNSAGGTVTFPNLFAARSEALQLPPGSPVWDQSSSSQFVVGTNLLYPTAPMAFTVAQSFGLTITGTGSRTTTISTETTLPPDHALRVDWRFVFTNAQFTADNWVTAVLEYSTDAGASWIASPFPSTGITLPGYARSASIAGTFDILASTTSRRLRFRIPWTAASSASTAVSRLDYVSISAIATQPWRF